MDQAAEKKALEDEQLRLEQYLDHPVTRRILEDNKEQQEEAINLILNRKVTTIADFFDREQLIGHLRGLRRFAAHSTLALDEVKEKLKELK